MEFLYFWPLLSLDTETETCEEDRLILKRRLTASAIEIEKQIKHGYKYCNLA
ncbi:hypothetical protein ACJIZ3_025192 [Penstemon smallii]|uniref:Uncharacterized protein n=1 Tax=Penstemon smallii TaxID=265156 RepID=A0ABD3TVL4_9LAMI